MSTVTAEYDESSTCPTSCLPIAGYRPIVPRPLLTTLQVTFDAAPGARPSTSRSKSSTISGRRWVHHVSAVVTLVPFLSVRTSGRSGNGLAVASS